MRHAVHSRASRTRNDLSSSAYLPCVETKSIAWRKAKPFGAEFVDVRVGRDDIAASGVALGSDPVPYRLDYVLETGAAFVTVRFSVAARGDGWMRKLDLHRSRSGTWTETWTAEGTCDLLPTRATTNLSAISDALDVDLGLSPLFNTMPVLRAGLLRSHGTSDFVMAWVSVPNLTVHRSPQRYSFVRLVDDERSIVRFESLAADGFSAGITYDASGFVIDYPGIGSRITARS